MTNDSAYSKHGTVMSLPLLTMALTQVRDEFKSIEHMVLKDSLHDSSCNADGGEVASLMVDSNGRVNLLASESMSRRDW